MVAAPLFSRILAHEYILVLDVYDRRLFLFPPLPCCGGVTVLWRCRDPTAVQRARPTVDGRVTVVRAARAIDPAEMMEREATATTARMKQTVYRNACVFFFLAEVALLFWGFGFCLFCSVHKLWLRGSVARKAQFFFPFFCPLFFVGDVKDGC